MKEGNFAFIDSQNVNLAIQRQGWKLDWAKFRQYLYDRYHVQQVFLFIGYSAGNQNLYRFLSYLGYILVYKPTIKLPSGEIKGNIDAELVLQTMIEWNNYKKAVIVTSDGDFYCLVRYLLEKDKLETLLIPDKTKFSTLLKEFRPYTHFMNELQQKLSYKKSP